MAIPKPGKMILELTPRIHPCHEAGGICRVAVIVEANLNLIVQMNSYLLVERAEPTQDNNGKCFQTKIESLSPTERSAALSISFDDFSAMAAELITCVGCRRGMDRIMLTVIETGNRGFYPILVVENERLFIAPVFSNNNDFIFDIFYCQKDNSRLEEIVRTSAKVKAGRRCNLHSISGQKLKITDKWMDTWNQMDDMGKKMALLIPKEYMDRALKEYLVQNRFCEDCAIKVTFAYEILTGIETNIHKEYDPSIFANIIYCSEDKMFILSSEIQFVMALIDRAEPLVDPIFPVERHAKSVPASQEEVLNCIALFLFHRLIHMHRRFTEDILAWEQIMTVATRALRRNFELAVESKNKESQPDLWDDRKKKQKQKKNIDIESAQAKKREKRRRQRQNKKNRNADSDEEDVEAEVQDKGEGDTPVCSVAEEEQDRVQIAEIEVASTSRTEAESNSSNKPLNDSNKVSDAKPPKDSNKLPDPKPLKDSNKLPDPKPLKDSNKVPDTKPLTDSNKVSDTKPLKNSNKVSDTKPLKNSNKVLDTKPLKDSNKVEDTKPLKDSNKLPDIKPLTDSNKVPNAKQLTDPNKAPTDASRDCGYASETSTSESVSVSLATTSSLSSKTAPNSCSTGVCTKLHCYCFSSALSDRDSKSPFYLSLQEQLLESGSESDSPFTEADIAFVRSEECKRMREEYRAKLWENYEKITSSSFKVERHEPNQAIETKSCSESALCPHQRISDNCNVCRGESDENQPPPRPQSESTTSTSKGAKSAKKVPPKGNRNYKGKNRR